MQSRLFLQTEATADANGGATFRFAPAPMGMVLTGVVSVTDASPAATFSVTAAGQPWGQWTGPAAGPLVQGWVNELIEVTAAGLFPGQQYKASFIGTQEDERYAAPLAPTPTVPLFTQRLLGAYDLAGATSGSFDVVGLQPSDAYLILTPTGADGVLARGSTVAIAAGTNSVVLDVPSGVEDGDVLVMGVATGQAITITTPAGWTALDNTSNGTAADPRLATFYRVAASEPANYTINMGGVGRAVAVMAGYLGIDTANPIDVSAANNSGAAASVNVVANSTTPATAAQLVGFFASESATTFTPPATMTELQDTPSTLVTLEAADELRAAAGATGTRTAVAATSARWAAATVALRPSGVGHAGDPLLINATDTAASPERLSYGASVMPGYFPLGMPVLPLVDNAVKVFWHCNITTRTNPTNLRVYASPSALPVFPFLFGHAGYSGGGAAVGTVTILGDNRCVEIRDVAFSVRGAGRVELRFAYFVDTNGAADYIELGVVSLAGVTTQLSYEFGPGELVAGSIAGLQGGDAVVMVVSGGALDDVNVGFTYVDLAN